MSNRDSMLSKAVLTRFSHDMAGAVSAVSNSLSLLAELGGADEETMALATDSADTLMARLRFFRAAFGNEGPLTDMGVTQQIFDDYLKTLENSVVRLVGRWNTDTELPLFMFRMMLLAGLIVAESLIRGGTVTVTARAGTKEIRVEGVGQSIKTDAGVLAALEQDGTDEVTPKNVPAVFLRSISAEQGWRIDVSTQPDGMVLVLSD